MSGVASLALAHYGAIAQTRKAVEELTELSLALQRDLDDRGDKENILEEMADVKVIMESLELIYGDPSSVVAQKKARLMRRIGAPC